MVFLSIGERINATRKDIGAAIKERNEEVIRAEIEKQIDGGAVMLDINGGTSPKQEKDNMLWLADLVARNCDAPLCIDSANPEVIEAAIGTMREARGGDVPGSFETEEGLPWLVVNSISAKEKVYDSLLPALQKYNCGVIALCMAEGNEPLDAVERTEIGAKLVRKLNDDGIASEKIYVDPLVMPIGVDARNGMATVEIITNLKKQFPGLRSACGLSNVSFGIPARPLVNRTFLAILAAAGLDGAIMDTSDAKLMSTLRAALALAGRDEGCIGLIQAYRKKLLVV